jgi:hypothetical protein
MMSVARHTVIFRDSLLFMFRLGEFESRELSNPSAIDTLYSSARPDESELSRILRLRVLKSNYDAWKAAYA